MEERAIQDQDPAERLASALGRIAVGVERREAVAAAAQAALDAASEMQAAIQRPSDGAADLPALAGTLDAMIARLRGVLAESGRG